MSESAITFPLPSSEPKPLDGGVLGISIPDLEFDTHSTSQEHATKEYGSFEEFQWYLSQERKRLPADIEKPFEHYLLKGPGRFYRAYNQPGEPLVAGMAISPDEDGYKVDATYSVEQNGIAAAAYRAIITRKFFGEFCGHPMLSRASHLRVPAEMLTGNLGLARAVYEFGLVNGSDFIIPMPGVVPFPFENMSQADQQGARNLIKDRSVTGVLPYSIEGAKKWSATEEFYQNGVFVGSVVETRDTTTPGRATSLEAWDPNGHLVEFRDVELVDVSTANEARRVHFLKTMAEADSTLAKAILG